MLQNEHSGNQGLIEISVVKASWLPIDRPPASCESKGKRPRVFPKLIRCTRWEDPAIMDDSIDLRPLPEATGYWGFGSWAMRESHSHPGTWR
jgi:hypothetical protein